MVTTDLVTAILVRALVKLKHFSLPHVGKFEYVRKSAVLNPNKKVLTPPLALYRLRISDYSEVNRFVDFLVMELSCTSREANMMAEEIGHFLNQYLRSVGSLELPGIGVLKSKPDGSIQFENSASLDAFGLYPIPFTTVKASERKTKFKRDREKQEKPRFARVVFMYIFLSLLVMAFVGLMLYVIFYPQLSEFTGFKVQVLDEFYHLKSESGLEKQASKEGTISAKQPDKSTSEIVGDTLRQDSVVNKQELSGSEPLQVRYHIIVQSVQGREKAEAEAKRWKEKGYDPEILPHDEREGWYRISLYRSLSRREAQRYLQQLESQGIKDGWIYLEKK